METNLSILDTILRIFIACLWAGIFGALGSFIGVFAVYFLVTGLSGWDPLYQSMGWNTRQPDSEDHHVPSEKQEKKAPVRTAA